MEEILDADEYYISRMLLDQQARAIAGLNKVEYAKSVHRLAAEVAKADLK